MPGPSSAILTAIYAGDTDRLAALLAARPELDVFEAAAVGDAARLRRLLRADPALVRARSADGWTALHLAAYFGHGDAVERLLAAGADPRALSSNRLRNTPLHAALAGRGNVRIVAALLARGADVNALAAGGFRPLHLAAARGDLTIIEMLLVRGADARARTEDGSTARVVAEEHNQASAARRLRGEEP
ncbi:MAG: ankyrin repeat domain-containing protein [Candidatus Rokubacteria bacterium]|nr:ankyrin repeat domain-containing protein [Candidatus Rokubacteria bacterium]